MTTYAIGSVKGDYQSLQLLLQKIDFNPEPDTLWFSGNLVGSGPGNSEVLRFVKSLGKKAVTVLGDQELRLLGLASGFVETADDDTLHEVLQAPDRDELLKWIRQKALLHHDSKLNFTLAHAGIPGEWTRSQTLTFAYEVESVLSGSNYQAFLENRRQDQTAWHAKLRGWKRLNFICNAYTLMKYYNERGRLDFKAGGPVREQAEGLTPWYRVPDRITANLNIIFSDDADFQDAEFPGIYPLPANGNLCALNLSNPTERISI